VKGRVRRTVEMSKRVQSFSLAHPDPSQGYAAALARLQKTLAEVDVAAGRQRDGINAVRAATGMKRSGRRKILRTQMALLARVAESAEAEVPGIAQKFRLPREAVPYLAFRTAARGMLAEAQNQKELLVRHGLLEAVLDAMSDNLNKFEEAVEQGTEGRRSHVGASAELDALADELTQICRLMDAINRSRFSEDPESLAQWESASNVIGPARSAGGAESRSGGQAGGQSAGQSVSRSAGQGAGNSVTPTAGGEIKPAA
jgi:hypothetical protein